MVSVKFGAAIIIAGCLVMGHTSAQTSNSEKNPPASAAPAQAKLSSDSTVGEILDNPAAKAVLIKHIPALAQDDQIELARNMSLRSLQQYAPDDFSDQVLAALDADLAKLPANKPHAPANGNGTTK